MITPHDKISAAVTQLDVAAKALLAASECLVGLSHAEIAAVRSAAGQIRIEVKAQTRILQEVGEDLTPLRPASSTTVKAAFQTSSEFPRRPKDGAR